MDLVLEVLLTLLVLLPDFVSLPLDSLLTTNPLIFKLNFVAMLELLILIFPGSQLVHQVGPLQWEVLNAGRLLLKRQFELFIKTFNGIDLISLWLNLVSGVCKLFEKELIFDFKIFGPFEPDS